jgi:hypothetical protein
MRFGREIADCKKMFFANFAPVFLLQPAGPEPKAPEI